MKPPTLSAVTPPTNEFLRDVLAGLSQPQKSLSAKYLYDERGSSLFERICELPEYYLTRCELAILEKDAKQMADLIGRDAVLIEYGSGSSRKTRLLLDQLRSVTYVPVDISREHLFRSARTLATDYPQAKIVPVCADFTKPFRLPPTLDAGKRRVVYFSGSTIGNFELEESRRILQLISTLVGPGGGLLAGVDLKKDRAILEPAYDDAQGVTAAFTLNLLTRINRELDADFAVDRYRHRAVYNEALGRIEIDVVSLANQLVHVGGQRIRIAKGETIRTEYSQKFALEDFAHLAGRAGLEVREVWTDPDNLYSLQYAVALSNGTYR